MLCKRGVVGWFTFALIIAGPLLLWGADLETQEPKTPIALLEIQPAAIDWRPHVDYERLTLTVAGPGELFIYREFGAGETPSFSALDGRGGQLADGVYAYELRAIPRLDLELGKEVRAPLVQSGHLWVQGHRR